MEFYCSTCRRMRERLEQGIDELVCRACLSGMVCVECEQDEIADNEEVETPDGMRCSTCIEAQGY